MNPWRNRKTGALYVVEGKATNATDDRDGELMILYRRNGDGDLYVRDHLEFLEKFEPVEGEPGKPT